MKAIWITWERHRRGRELARALNLPLLEMVSPVKGPSRYLGLLTRTTIHLFRERPTHLFVQCPSVILGLWVSALKRLFGYVLIVDLHNEAVEPFINQSALYRWILRRIHRAADLGIVTNDALCAIVAGNGGRPAVLPDRLPHIEPAGDQTASSPPLVVFVCTYAPDEPYRAVIEAGRLLGGDAAMSITGRKPADLVLPQLPDNVTLTGFLPDAAYDQLLRDAAVVIDLTGMDNCLVCGAYEAVALHKPLVTSDTSALRSYFSAGAVFTRHEPDAIARAVREALAARATLTVEMKELQPQLTARWDRDYAVLVAAIESLRYATGHAPAENKA